MQESPRNTTPENKVSENTTLTNGNSIAKRTGQSRGLRIGNPGNKGGGDKPKAYKLWLKSLLDSEQHRREFEASMHDRADPNFMAATKYAGELSYGKQPDPPAPTEPMSHEALLARLGSEVVRRNLDALNPPKQLKPGES